MKLGDGTVDTGWFLGGGIGARPYMDVEAKIGVQGKPPNHPFVHRVFHYKPSILGTPIFGNTHMILLCVFMVMIFTYPC